MIKKLIVLSAALLPFLGISQGFYKQPKMSYNQRAGETVTDLSFKNKSIEEVQTAIDKEHKKSDILRITLSGSFSVSKSPIKLPNKTILFLNNATIKASNDVTAIVLISIEDGQFISISSTGGGVLDGNNKNIKAIDVVNSGKTHIDNVTIKGCKNGGLVYLGKGLKEYADAGSITRSTIKDCGEVGISITNSFNFICEDNEISNSIGGIYLNADNVAIANNKINNCTSGIRALSQYDAIAYNSITNCGTAVSLDSSCLEAFVGNNIVKNNKVGFNLNSIKARVYNNDCDNRIEVIGHGSANQLYANKGITIIEGNNSGCDYFNPPLVGNMHNDLIKEGIGRWDITIKDTLLKDVRSIIDQAHKAHNNDIIVVHLDGRFTTSGETDSLKILDNECILLNGTINGTGKVGKLICFQGSITSSFSGGTIDGNGTNGDASLVYITGAAKVIFDSVTVINSKHQGITKRNSHEATYIRGCTVQYGSRCIWQLAADRLFAFENRCTNGLMDGIDLDAYTTNSVVMKNYSCSNRRHGVFVEEGANGHIVLGNTLDSNRTGVSYFNMEVNEKHCSRNLIASNLCRANDRGIQVNAKEESKATKDNVIFDNVCADNEDVGIGGYYGGPRATNNYNAMNTMIGNQNGAFMTRSIMETNTVWNALDAVSTLPAELYSLDGKPAPKGIFLSWNTTNEYNCKSFEIERTITMKDYKTIATVNASSTSTSKNSYTFNDTSAANGINFYRIKSVGTDGKTAYSKIVAIENRLDNAFDLKFINLKNNAFQVETVTQTPFNSMDIQLFDLSGNLVYKEDFKTNGGNDFMRVIKLDNINTANYILCSKTSFGYCFKKVLISKY